MKNAAYPPVLSPFNKYCICDETLKKQNWTIYSKDYRNMRTADNV